MATYRRMLTDLNGNNLIPVTNLDESAGTWTTLIFERIRGNTTVPRTTNKGTVLTFDIRNGGSCVYIKDGAQNIKKIRGSLAVAPTANMTAAFGINGLKASSKAYTRWIGFHNGNYVTTTITGSAEGSDGSAYTGICADMTNWSGARAKWEAVPFIYNANNTIWAISGSVGVSNNNSSAWVETECTCTKGSAPTYYARGITTNNLAKFCTVIEVLEA